MLTPRQQETIDNLARKGIITSNDIIAYCLFKLKQPRRVNGLRKRRHSKEYYHEIINYYSKVAD